MSIRKQLWIATAAAAFAISPMAFAQNTPPDQSQNATNAASDNSIANETQNAKEPKDASAIQKTLAQVAEASVTKNGVNDMVERFSQQDRQRLDQDKQALKNSDTLNGRIAEFEKDWKAKYGHEFKIHHPNKAFDQSFAMITEEAGNGAQTASGHVNGNENENQNTNNNEKNNNEKSEKSATINIPSRHDMAALDVPLVRQSGKWKIDIPDSVDSKKLSDNVLTALTKFDEAKDQWPSDETQAQRRLTHEVLLGVFDKTNASGAQPAGAQVPAEQHSNSSTPSQSQ